MFYEGLTLASFEYHWADLYFLSSFSSCILSPWLYTYTNGSHPNTSQLPYLNLSVCSVWSMKKGE